MHPLRREVEPPPRLHQRAWFYLGLASFLFSLSIIADAALWARPTVAASRAAAVRRLHVRPCTDRRDAYHSLMRDIAETEVHAARLERERTAPGEFHDQLIEQLEHSWAIDDDLSPDGRYGNVDQRTVDDGAPGNDETVNRRLRSAGIISAGRDAPVRR